MSRLHDFEKYLNWLIREEIREKKAISFLLSVCKYAFSILLPMIAIMVSMMAYFDSIQEKLDDVVQQVKQQEIQVVLEQLQYRVDTFREVSELFAVGVCVVLTYVIIMLFFYLENSRLEKTILFLTDYKKCIKKIRSEKKYNRDKPKGSPSVKYKSDTIKLSN